MNAARLPSFSVIQAALRKTTEHLASELISPGDAVPLWNGFEWSVARSVAAMQGISALLANRLQWQGPADWCAFLAEQRHHGRLRHEHIGELLARIDAGARNLGIGIVALKGAALRDFDLYAAGERPMGDIDLLIAADDLGAIGELLRSIDYRDAFTTRRHAVFEPCGKRPCIGYGEHIDNAPKIEVHTRIAEPLPMRPVDITSGLFPEKLHPGINAYRDAGALMQHLLLHAAGNIRAHALRQIQLHDIALLARRLKAQEWDVLLDTTRPEPGCWWALPPLALTARYYPGSIPDGVLTRVRAAGTWLLRQTTAHATLTATSWSNLRIAAFPGIAWSRSPLEALRFARSRLLPGRVAIAELSLAHVAQPSLKGVPWYGLGQAQRIVRWLFSKPPRVQTMVSLREALRSGDDQSKSAA